VSCQELKKQNRARLSQGKVTFFAQKLTGLYHEPWVSTYESSSCSRALRARLTPTRDSDCSCVDALGSWSTFERGRADGVSRARLLCHKPFNSHAGPTAVEHVGDVRKQLLRQRRQRPVHHRRRVSLSLPLCLPLSLTHTPFSPSLPLSPSFSISLYLSLLSPYYDNAPHTQRATKEFLDWYP